MPATQPTVLALILALTSSCSVASVVGVPIACDVDAACPLDFACREGICVLPPTRVPADREAPDEAPCATVLREPLVDGLAGIDVFEEGATSSAEGDAVAVELPPSESLFFATIANMERQGTGVRYEVPILDGVPFGSGQQFYIGMRVEGRLYELLLFDDGLAVARFKEPDREHRDLFNTVPALNDAPHPIRLRLETNDDAGPVVRAVVSTDRDGDVFAAAFPAPSTAADEFYFAAQNFAPVDDVNRLRVGQAEVRDCGRP
jgi:hypothetical protein